MDFRLDDELLALRDAVDGLCTRHFDLGAVATREGMPASAAVWADLAAMGVLGFLAPGGGGAVAAAVALEALGAHLATGPVLWSVIAAPLVDGVADGAVRVTGVEATTGPVVVPHATETDVLLVLHADRIERGEPGTLDLVAVPEPFDPLTPAATGDALPPGEVVGDADAAHGLRRAGAVLAAAALVGGAQSALDVARDYALERHQFGVPIGSFQAVKHLLADMYGRVELARAATYAAAAILDDPRAGDPDEAASIAKLLAAEAGIANARTAVQILGGMGFTWEMLPHYFLKRAWLLATEFGTADEHALALGDALGAKVAAWT